MIQNNLKFNADYYVKSSIRDQFKISCSLSYISTIYYIYKTNILGQVKIIKTGKAV